ncbi:hypothetical protein MROS_0085 [Melioribacter roseus P3M-2]|uniref:Uncharacterized protein n=1 Tax=Melioribacter roseus (strain DSM 23840 / JCM 17771 / VKM B-2668 / P3M-2) TaxID=1191523 RepID=I6ZMT5_MELRP|nr:T9SS type A sorting domain-containing protein [Melioribacter roseus]AFN73329.1 hypothetical protein MROS_0085 [Melioribacter roseus P3M-2]
MYRKIIFASLVIILTSININSQIYVAPDGDDSNPGAIDRPLESLQKAQELAKAGDTVYIGGGLYKVREDRISRVVSNLFACVTYLDKSGTEGNTIKYWAYPGETPVFDFSDVMPANQRVVGIYVIGNYIHLKGIEMTGIQVTITSHTESYCIYSRGNNNIFEQISMHDNVGTGLRHYKGGNNLFLNCDSYRNWDNVSEDGLGGNTDGFGCHPDASGTGTVFKGCRAWFNSDDGFDIIRADASVVFDSCWAFYNGYSASFQSLGDGNGFKAGGFAHDTADRIPNPVPMHTIQFCIAAKNKANGFYANHHLAGNYWYNNSAYQNTINFNMLNRPSREDADNIDGDGYDHILKNNLSYQKGFGNKHIAYIDTSRNILVTNSWQFDLTLSDADFKSLDINLLTSPRKEDGSLPDIDFMSPAQGGKIIDAGTDIGFPYFGNAPDLGAIESGFITSINLNCIDLPDNFKLYQNYPNPFNPVTNILYELSEPAVVNLAVFNSSGQKIATLVSGFQERGSYKLTFDGEGLASGVYFYKLKINDNSVVKQMTLLK